MADRKKSFRKMRTATDTELSFTNVSSEDPQRKKEAPRMRAKSVGGSAGAADAGLVILPSPPKKSVSTTPRVLASDSSSRRMSGSGDSRVSPEVVKGRSPEVLKSREDKCGPPGPTMRHLVKLVQRLMSEYQFSCAARLLDRMSKEVLLTQIWDTPVPAAWNLTSNLLDFAETERDRHNGLINNFVQNVAELVGSDSEKTAVNNVELGSNLLDKLNGRDQKKARAPDPRGKSGRKPAQVTLSSSLGLDSASLGVQRFSSSDQTSGGSMQKRRSEAVGTTGRASLLERTDETFHKRRSTGSCSPTNLQALQKVHSELTGMAPRQSLTHTLGLHLPTIVKEGSSEIRRTEGRRPSASSDASMVEDDTNEFGGRDSNASWHSPGSRTQSPAPDKKNSITSTNSRLELVQQKRASLSSAASLGAVSMMVGDGGKTDGVANSNEFEDVQQLPNSLPNLSKDECRRCGNIFMCDANFCRKCGLERKQAGTTIFGIASKSSSLDSDLLPQHDKADFQQLSRGLQGLLSWRLQGEILRSNAEDAGGERRATSISAETLSSAIRWKRSNSEPLPPRSSREEHVWESMESVESKEEPCEIKVTEPAESGFKETRFKILVPTGEHENESNCSEEEAKEVIFKPTGSIVGSGATIHAQPQGAPKVRRQKSISVLPDIFKENLDEDRAAYLSLPSHKFIVHPNGMFRMSWDLMSLCIILFEAIILPLALCFGIYPPDYVMWISTLFFTPDLILNMFTGFYHNGLLILRQKIILKRYLTGWFAIDFLSTVPWEAFFNSQQGQAGIILKFAKISKLMRVLRLLRVLKLKALLQRVEDMCSSYVVLVTLSITKIVAFYMLVCHWTACAWGWLGAADDLPPIGKSKSECEPDGPCENGIGIRDSPWRRRYGVMGEPPVQHYLIALQFSTGLLTGAELQLMPGYWMERIFLTGMMIVSFLVCSMIISQIVVVMDKINQDNSEYLEHSRVIRDFMVSRGMPIKLQTKVKRYLEYQFKSRKVVHQNHDILFKLSPYLRMEIQEHMNKAILEHHPFFKGMENSVLSQVCSLAQSVLYAPGDVVMRKGQIESLICFIVRGQLQIVEARKGVSIYIKAPAWTGDRGLFVASIRMHTVTCSMHSELLTICQQDLIDLVRSIPAAEEYIKEYCKRVIKNDPSTIFCHFCRGSRHDMDTCAELTEALMHQDKAVRLVDNHSNEAWYQRAKNSLASKNSPPPPGKRDSLKPREIHQAHHAHHVAVQGRTFGTGSISSDSVHTGGNTTLAAEAYAAWEED